MLTALDRNWAWVIVATSFCNQFIALGFSFSLGIYNVEFLEEFGDTKANTAWVSSMNLAFVFGAGPVVAYAMDRTSIRLIACLGALVSTAGIILSMFATKLFHLYITIGVIVGTGNCMVYVPSAVLVGLYFTKNRTFATALSSGGSSVGMVLMPIIYTKIIEAYTWRGSMFILAGLCMQMLVFSALLRPVSDRRNMEEDGTSESAIQTQRDLEMESSSKKDSESEGVGKYISHEKEERSIGKSNLDCDDAITKTTDGCSVMSEFSQANYDGSDPMSRISFEHLEHERMLSDETGDVRTHNENSGFNILLYKARQNVMFDFRFFIYLTNNVMWNLGTCIVTVMTADYMYVTGANKLQFSIIMLMLGVGSITGAILFAIIGKWKPFDLVSMYSGLCLSCGLASALIAVSTDVVVIGVLGTFFGIASGGMVSWLLAVLAELIGTSKLGEAFGYLMLANGLGSLAGPPLGGWLYDVSGNYNATFWIAGSLIFASGMLMATVPLKQKYNTCSATDS